MAGFDVISGDLLIHQVGARCLVLEPGCLGQLGSAEGRYVYPKRLVVGVGEGVGQLEGQNPGHLRPRYEWCFRKFVRS